MGMTWSPPEIDRTEPTLIADERTMLESWLEFHRQTLLIKCAGLTADQLRLRAVEPSRMSLLGLVRHMSEVERSWFRRRVSGEDVDYIYCSDADMEADFDGVDTADPEVDFATYQEELDAVRLAARVTSLDDTFFHPRLKADMSVRWVYVHMIEEYARHNGHADLIRERIDGATGE
jgi:uncharacterized damage-inducible protein DinB